MVATQHSDSGVVSCRFKSNFTSTNQSFLLSVGLCNVPFNTWTWGLSPVNSLPLTSLSYCLSASVRCPSTPRLGAESCIFPLTFPSTGQSVLLSVGQCKVPLNTWTRGLSPVFSHPTILPLASLSYCPSASVWCLTTPGLGD